MRILKPIVFSLFAFLVMQIPLYGQSQMPKGVTPVERGPVHEAFVPKVAGAVILEAVMDQPPPPVMEKIPQQIDQSANWISGYWSWDKQRRDYVWVSGVWRKAPPAHQWISGFWKHFDTGWVWIPGFWSPKPLQQMGYIQKIPPDSIDENVGNPPGNDFFWAPGYWMYSKKDHDFYFVKGTWERIDPHWVWVPAHYMWHPEGYIFITGYWDWTLEDRGQAFATVYIDPHMRTGFAFEPTIVLHPPVIIDWLFPYFPDHLCFFYHWHHFHPGFWNNWCCVPPWWGWNTWWSFPWHNAWGLWWWWGHPGFLHPWWITSSLAGMIPPPIAMLFSMLDGLFGPQFILMNGMVTPNQLLKAISSVTGNDMPIMPSDPEMIHAIQELAGENVIEAGPALRPSGPQNGQPPFKPWLDPDALEELPPNRVVPQEIPKMPQARPETYPPPPIRQPQQPPVYRPKPPVYRPQPPVYQPRPPVHKPRPPVKQPQPPIYKPRPPVNRPYPPRRPPQTYPRQPNYPPQTNRPTYPPNRGTIQPQFTPQERRPIRPIRPFRPQFVPQTGPKNPQSTPPPNSNRIFK